MFFWAKLTVIENMVITLKDKVISKNYGNAPKIIYFSKYVQIKLVYSTAITTYI